ncbi:hypothetical protein [Limnoglobus roseus]|uniref:hypothetical protein n=1 Tax=Limnoglobus roseus TaxID=2598579 RepID=UPI00143D0B54|nr:hypothetical protein [Limnoglobus roseus]
MAAFEMDVDGVCINVLSVFCFGLNAAVGGANCCTSGPCGSGSRTDPYGGGVLVAKGSTFPPPPPPMSAYKQV